MAKSERDGFGILTAHGGFLTDRLFNSRFEAESHIPNMLPGDPKGEEAGLKIVPAKMIITTKESSK